MITSKGQPGVAYFLLSGFTAEHSSSRADSALYDLKGFLTKRNTQIIESLNSALTPLHIDYQTDVVSLSAGETPTERHLMAAYYRLGKTALADPVTFWSDKLDVNRSEIEHSYSQPAAFRRLMRNKLVKAGGIAFQPPDASNFPPIELLNRIADLTGTLPTLVWGRGTSDGEREEAVLLKFLVQRGLLGLNIVPDRSINVPASEKEFHLKCLYEVVDLAAQHDLPIFIGTEMNQPGHQDVDDINIPELLPFKQVFMDGAYLLHGHTILARQASMGYRSDWSVEQFRDRRSRNAFYTKLGALLPNTVENRNFLQSLPSDLSARDLLALVEKKFS